MHAAFANYLRTVSTPLHALDIYSDVGIRCPRTRCFVILLKRRIFSWRRVEANCHLILANRRSTDGKQHQADESDELTTG
jgi:hypothetical protein